MANSNPSNKFRPGVSGNTGGLTQALRKARGLAREQIAKIFAEADEQGITFEERLWRWWLNHSDATIRAKGIARARDELYGAPMMRAEVTGVDGGPIELVGMNREQLAEREATLVAELRALPTGDEGEGEIPE